MAADCSPAGDTRSAGVLVELEVQEIARPLRNELERVPEGAQITVEDLGPGVPEEFRAHMFEPFRQGENAVSHAPGVGKIFFAFSPIATA